MPQHACDGTGSLVERVGLLDDHADFAGFEKPRAQSRVLRNVPISRSHTHLLQAAHETHQLRHGVSKLKDISLLSTMPALEEIDLSGTYDVEDFRPLLDLPSLKKLEIPPGISAWESPREFFVAVMTELEARGVSAHRR